MAFKNNMPGEWGSAQNVPPNLQAVASIGTGFGNLVRLVNLNGAEPEQDPENVTIQVYATVPVNPAQPALPPTPPGPLVGIAEFSGGGGGGRIEFDIPCNASGGAPTTNSQWGVSPGGGAIVTVPAGDVKVYARNDANFFPSLPEVTSLPIGVVQLNPDGTPKFVPNVSAFAAYGNKTGRLTRTVWAMKMAPPPGAKTATVNVPPFARTFRVLREFGGAPGFLTVELVTPDTSLIDTFTLAAGVMSPDFVVGPAAQVVITTDPAAAIRQVALVFDLEN